MEAMEDKRGARLKPSTVETVRDQLEFQRYSRPSWLEYHFPKISQRGTPVEYEDVLTMGEREADSVRSLLASQIVFGRKKAGKAQARALTLLSEEDSGQDNEWSVRVAQFEEALRDLCGVYGLPSLV